MKEFISLLTFDLLSQKLCLGQGAKKEKKGRGSLKRNNSSPVKHSHVDNHKVSKETLIQVSDFIFYLYLIISLILKNFTH